jgi:hypothetical protein
MGFSLLVAQQAARKGRKSAQNDRSRKAVFFRLTRSLILGKFVPATDTNLPGFDRHTARPWRALLFLALEFSRWLMGRRRESVRRCVRMPEDQSAVESL